MRNSTAITIFDNCFDMNTYYTIFTVCCKGSVLVYVYLKDSNTVSQVLNTLFT